MLYSLLTLSASQVFSLVEHFLSQSPDQHTPSGICYTYLVSKGYNKKTIKNTLSKSVRQ